MIVNMPNRADGWYRRRCAPLLVGGVLIATLAPGVQAQNLAANGVASSTSQAVVQPIPGAESMRLNAALSRLARDARDVPALIDAGQASLDLGDFQAAIGFYQRADAISPGNARVKAGLAGAFVQAEDPFSAIPLFEEAAKAGPLDANRLADRALAYDLVGDSVSAQQYYRQALAAGADDEIVRRLALSQAIAGDKRGMEVTLAPLLQKQDKSSWRTRAFALAILGQTEEAESIARSTLPADMAGAISAYLRFMPRLTAAQQAAAANLGRFPRAAEIGIDDPRFAAYARPRAVLASASQSLTPVGEPLGKTARAGKPADDRRTRREREQAEKAAARAAKSETRPALAAAAPPPEPHPGRETTQAPIKVAVAAPVPPPPSPAPVKVALAAPPPAPVKAASTVPPPSPAPVKTAPGPGPGFGSLESDGAGSAQGFDLRQVATTQSVPKPAAATTQTASAASTASPPPAPLQVATVAPPPPPPPPAVKAAPPKPAPAAPRPRQLEDVFADLTPPSRQAEAAAGAVDVRRIKPVRVEAAAAPACEPAPDPKAKGAKAAPKGKQAAVRVTKGSPATQCVDVKKPAVPSHPSRIWVQVATGRDRKALAFDWRRMVKEDATVFASRKGFTSAWGQTNRLLTGPFETEAAANAFIARLKKAGVDGSFLWTSPAGQVVDAVSAGS